MRSGVAVIVDAGELQCGCGCVEESTKAAVLGYGHTAGLRWQSWRRGLNCLGWMNGDFEQPMLAPTSYRPAECGLFDRRASSASFSPRAQQQNTELADH